jgi:hypothetical protein
MASGNIKGVSRGILEVLEGCYRDVTGMWQICYRDVTGMLQGCYRGVRGVLHVCHRDVTDLSWCSMGTGYWMTFCTCHNKGEIRSTFSKGTIKAGVLGLSASSQQNKQSSGMQ